MDCEQSDKLCGIDNEVELNLERFDFNYCWKCVEPEIIDNYE